MSNIINKSNHPVQIKRINVRIWKLRDEIEKAILLRMQECEKQGIELDIEDIKKFYSRQKPAYLSPDYDPDDENDSDESQEAIGADGLDSSGNVMDEEALAMMAAMGGGEEAEEKSEEDSEEKPEEDEDDEASKLAAEMLGDQAPKTEEEDEASKLAAEMLGDQGPKTEEEDEASKLAAEMLGDQGQTSEVPIEESKSLKRILPDEDKISYGFALLSDIDMDQILAFSKDSFTYGQNICIEFLIPKSFILSGEVISANHIGRTSKIISETKPEYRVLTSFSYLFEEERTNLRNFLQSVEPDIPPPPKKLKRPDSDDEDEDEFEDLGF